MAGCTGIDTIEEINADANVSVPIEALDRRDRPESTRTRRETATETTQSTETTEITEEPSRETIFEDTWEDEDYTSNPVWTMQNNEEAQIWVVNTDSLEDQTWAVELAGEPGSTARLNSYDEFSFRRPWMCEGLVATTNNQGFESKIKLANATHPRLTFNITPEQISFEDSLNISSPPSTEFDTNSETWYRYRIRHDGERLYQAKIWDHEEDEPGWQLSATGSRTGEGRVTLENEMSESEATVKHAYIHVYSNG